MKYSISLALQLLIAGSLHAQPEIDAFNLYDRGNSPGDMFADIYLATNGDYLVCGQSNYRSWVMRIDGEGRSVWEFTLNDGARLFSLIEADNGDIISVGTLSNITFGALRLTNEGELVWRREYVAGRANAVIELKEGDFMICGVSPSGGRGFITRIDEDGDQVWGRNYQDERSIFYGMRQTDDGIVLCGQIGSRGLAKKIDLDGEEIWTQSDYDHGGSQIFTSIVSIPQGFALGATQRLNSQIVRIAGNGDMLGSRVIEEVAGVYCEGIAKSRDGSFVLVGQQTIGERHYPVCIRVDQQGGLQWTKNFHEFVDTLRGGINSLYTALVLPGDVIIACGTIYNNFEDHLDDALIVRMTPDPLYPSIFYKLPEDSIQTRLEHDSIQFVVRARDRLGREMNYEWLCADTLLQQGDTTLTVEVGWDTTVFDYPITCRVWNEDGEVRTGWLIQSRKFFIHSHSPDTLDLTLRRGSIADFSIDSVAAVNRDGLTYAWSVSREEEGIAEYPDTSENISFDFIRSGHYTVEGFAYIPDGPSDAVAWDVEVRGAIWSFLPEETGWTGLIGSNVEFQIIPTISDSLNWYTWLYDGGMIREGWDSTFTMNFFELGEHTIIGILADSIESDTVEWVVNVLSDFVGQGGQDARPTEFGIESVSPNPFNAMLTIRLSVGAQGLAPLRLAVYDLTGREVARLLDPKSEIRNQKSEIIWNASSVPAGVYLIRLESGSSVQTMKVVLLR